MGHVHDMVRSLFPLLGLAQQAFKIRLRVWYFKKFHGFLLESCVVFNTNINKVWGNWTLSANLDICLHLQVNTFPFKLKCPSSLPPPNWSFKWPVRPSSCDNTILPSPDIFLYLHSSLGLFLGLCTTSGIYQHEACWKMDGSEKSERRVKLSWKCLAFP